MTGLSNARALVSEPVCPPATATRASCASQVLYDGETGLYAHADLARPGGHTRAAAMAVLAGPFQGGWDEGPFSPTLPRGAMPTAAPAGSREAPEGASPPVGGTPAFLLQAYDLTALSAAEGTGDKVGIVDAYWDSEAESDLATYRSTFGLPACEKASGCFTQVNESGATGSGSCTTEECKGWQLETSLDIETVSAICPNCHILLVEAKDAELAPLSKAESEAYTLGANQVSDSWTGERRLELASKHAAIATVAASGDDGEWKSAAYPAGEDAVTAVGGTDLLSAQAGGAAATRGAVETAWSKTGSGCSSETKPSWQRQTACADRSANDISADADPDTGLDVYDPGYPETEEGWLDVGGTSLATPITAAYYALNSGGAGDGSAEWDYNNASLLNDIASGSNGTCGSLLCQAGPGYDGPTGNGSISGDVVEGAPGVGGPSQVDGSYLTATAPETVTLTGGVYPNGLETEYWWEYGPTKSYGHITTPTAIGDGGDAPAGSGGVSAAEAIIERLAPETTYHYRLVASNEKGTTYGYDFQFTTAPPSAGFVVEAEQKLEGEVGYTRGRLVGRVGETVDYKVTVRNTGNTELSLGALSESGCESVVPGGPVRVAVGASQAYTCEHKGLAVGAYASVASVSNDSEASRESNKLEVEVPAQPGFVVEAEQKLEGEVGYTRGRLVGRVGETVDYKVTVRNTGNTELSLGALSESGCESVVPGGPVRVAVGASQAYTCEHKGLAVGAYANVASVSNDSEASRESNKLEVEVPAQPGFVVEAEQKLEGEVGYTRGRLVGRVGETVDYKVTVRNTGNTELSLGALSESGCESVVPGGPVRVAVGASQAYTCEHKGLAVGAYANVASVSNDSEAPRESNKLEVEVPAEPGFVVEAEQKLEGEVGYTRGGWWGGWVRRWITGSRSGTRVTLN